jgi:hypothetical protein
MRHDHRRPGQPLVRRRQVADEHHALVGPDLGHVALLGNVADQPGRIGEFLVAEMHHHALWPGIEFLDIGLAAQRLDEDDLQEVLHLDRQAARNGRSSRHRTRQYRQCR